VAAERRTVLVIGSGAAGTAAARSLAQAGWSVTVADHDRIGGTCLWRGCMPKKSLAHSAAVRRVVDTAEQFGIGVTQPVTDWQTVLAWKWHSEETYAGDQESLFASAGVRLAKATAHFVSPEQVSVGDSVLTPDSVVIATGSAPVLPPLPGIELADASDAALGYPEPPDTLLIVGGGFIGMEFAAIFASFGTKITLVSSGPRPLEMLDPDVAQVPVRRLGRMGVSFHSNCRMQALSGDPGDITATFLEKPTGETHEGTYARVLMAVGRRPSFDALDLSAGGIETDERGALVLDEFLRTSNPRVWAAGDAAGGMMQTPVASYQGRTVAWSIDSDEPHAPDYSAVPTTVYTVPQVAQVGLSEADAQRLGIPYRARVTKFDSLGAAIIEDERDGLVKLLFGESDGRLLGAHIAGPTASDLIYSLALGIRTGATDSAIRDTLGVHPAYCESVNWAAW